MPIAQFATGTYTGSPPSIGWSVLGSSNNATVGVVQLFINLSNMVGSTTPDTLEIQLNEKVSAGANALSVYTVLFSGVQADPIYASPTLVLMHGWDFQIRQTAGTARTFNWSIRVIT